MGKVLVIIVGVVTAGIDEVFDSIFVDLGSDPDRRHARLADSMDIARRSET